MTGLPMETWGPWLEGYEAGMTAALKEALRAYSKRSTAAFDDWVVEAERLIAIHQEHSA